EKAAAEYRAARDSASFQVRQELAEAEASARAARFAARTAEQRLRIMGLSAEAVQRLDALVLPEKPCDDPNCKDCATGASAEEREHAFGNGFASYEVRAPIAGRIVERHLSLGEKVGEDSDLFTVADTATVWAELTVHLRDLAALEVGAEVTIEAQHASAATRGRIAMLSPTVDAATRTATARVVIENDSGEWRPGVFVTGVVRVAAQSLPVVLPKQAVETVDGQAVVFVAKGDAFMPVPVETGLSDRERVEVVSGLSAGTPVVVKGAFAIKAKRVTSTLDSHAGHGH
ncbi:MAG: efflux RND transporter periplasmic adaptor subunit, partial [Lentisphaerae bacterium]|nr:efflux RND transporter periplasmic adaptor subunit [Lentisphaerota bacterium]